MTPDEFCYWFKKRLEIIETNPTNEEWRLIKEQFSFVEFPSTSDNGNVKSTLETLIERLKKEGRITYSRGVSEGSVEPIYGHMDPSIFKEKPLFGDEYLKD